MNPDDDPDLGPRGASEAWERCTTEVEAACRSDSPPAVAELPTWLHRVPVNDQPDLLVDLVSVHLLCGWESRRRPLLEDYVQALGARFPETFSHDRLPLDLIAGEFVARHSFAGTADHPTLEQYELRFKDHGAGNLIREEILNRCSDAGRYVRVGLLDQGAFGDVWAAYDQRLRRYVAIKYLKLEAELEERARERFRREACITAGLEHPSIVTLHDSPPIATTGDSPAASGERPSSVMRLVQGRNLETVILEQHDPGDGLGPAERRVQWIELLRRFIDVCNAIAYAHSHGVVHLDLKPLNVIAGGFGETVVLDWGGAERLDAAADSASDMRFRSRREEIYLTLVYAAPERIDGAAAPSCDVFSLGAILYQIITGRPPYVPHVGEGGDSFQARVQRADYPPPARLRPDVHPDLEAVCLKAMAANPLDRYPSASELGSEVARYLADEPVKARREPRSVHLRRWAKHHAKLVSSSLTASLLTTAALGFAIVVYRDHVRRDSETSEAALARVVQLGEDAQVVWASGLDPSAWKRAEDAAAAARASVGWYTPNELRRRLSRRADAVAVAAMQARSDAELLRDLAAVRALRGDPQFDLSSEYSRIIRKAGLWDQIDDPAAFVAQLAERPAAFKVVLASYLDDWAMSSPMRGNEGFVPARLVDAARGVDPDRRRCELRDAFKIPDAARRLAALRRLSDAIAEAEDVSPPLTIVLLAGGLLRSGDPDDAIQVLSKRSSGTDKDPLVYQAMGYALRAAAPSRREDALRAFTAAATLRPEMGYALAMELRHSGRTAEGVDVLLDVAKRHPLSAYEYRLAEMEGELGRDASARAHIDQAIRMSEARIDESPMDFVAWNDLGGALAARSGYETASAAAVDRSRSQNAFEKAIAIAPNNDVVYHNLGNLLNSRGDFRAAASAYGKAIRINPNQPETHNGLGNAYFGLSRFSEAEKEYQKATDLKADFADAHNNWGVALYKSGKFAEALRKCGEAIRLKPDHAPAYYSRGQILRAMGDLDRAAASYKKVVELKPDHALAHCELGLTYIAMGEFKSGLHELERGHAVGSSRAGWREPSSAWIETARGLADAEARFEDVVAVRGPTATPVELAGAAQVAYAKSLYVTTVRLFTSAFAGDPALADEREVGPRYIAARAAALAAAGKGKEKPGPDLGDLREKAYDWLAEDLGMWNRILADGPADAKRSIPTILRAWKDAPAFAELRGEAAFGRMSKAEGAKWRQLWSDVDELVRRAAAKALQDSHSIDAHPKDVFAR